MTNVSEHEKQQQQISQANDEALAKVDKSKVAERVEALAKDRQAMRERRKLPPVPEEAGA